MDNKLYVVIHALGIEGFGNHVRKEALKAKKAGADGVLLIPDYAKGDIPRATPDQLDICLNAIQPLRSDVFKIGVNYLDHKFSTESVKNKPGNFDLLQSDGKIFEELDPSQYSNITFFSALAFKYSKTENSTGVALKSLCNPYLSCSTNVIPTTSGTATGSAPPLRKLSEIREYLPTGGLAIASGVTIENVLSLMDVGVTDMIVATSLIYHVDDSGFDILNPEKVRGLADLIHGYKTKTV